MKIKHKFFLLLFIIAPTLFGMEIEEQKKEVPTLKEKLFDFIAKNKNHPALTAEKVQKLPPELQEEMQRAIRFKEVMQEANNDPKKALWVALDKNYSLPIKKIVESFRAKFPCTTWVDRTHDILHQYGVDEDDKHKHLLHYSVKYCSSDVVEQLINSTPEYDPQEDEEDESFFASPFKDYPRGRYFSLKKTNLLLTAVRNAKLKTAEMLLKNGANINATHPVKHFSALHIAAFQKDPFMCRLLLHHGADINKQIPQSDNVTPLMLAVKSGDTPTIEEFLKHPQCNIYAQDSLNRNVLHYAYNYAKQNKLNFLNGLVNTLRSKNADIKALLNQRLTDNATLLQLVVQNKNFSLARTLINHGAQPSSTMKYITPLLKTGPLFTSAEKIARAQDFALKADNYKKSRPLNFNSPADSSNIHYEGHEGLD